MIVLEVESKDGDRVGETGDSVGRNEKQIESVRDPKACMTYVVSAVH